VPKVRLVWPSLIAVSAALAVTAAHGQDLDAGKTGPQLFSQDCSACHRTPQGLTKTMSGGSLVSFLRQHYTSSAASANTIAAYLQAAGPGPRGAERPKDRPERQKDQAKQAQPPAAQPPQAQPPSPPPDRARVARPSEPIPSVPSAAQPETQPAPPASKKRERHARPLDPAANPQAPPPQGRRKARRPGQGEPTAAVPGPLDPPAYPPPPPNLAPAGTEASPPASTGSGADAASPRSAAPAQPSFVQPLP